MSDAAGRSAAASTGRTSSNSFDRIVEIDMLRGCAIAAVVGLHVSWTYLLPSEMAGAPGRLVALVALLCGFGVPLFLALSAAGLAQRHAAASSPADAVRFLWKRISRLMPAYLLWSILSAIAFRDEALTSPRSVASIVLRGTADGQFYFVPLLVEFYILWTLGRPLARMVAGHLYRSLALAGLAFAAMVVWWKLSGFGWVHGDVLQPMFWIGYFALGLTLLPVLGFARASARRGAILAASAFATAAAAYVMYGNVMASVEPHYAPEAVAWSFVIFQAAPAAYTVSVMLLLTLVCSHPASTRLRAPLTFAGTHSYGIFLVHLLVLRLLLHPLLPPDWLHGASAAVAAATVAAAWAACLAVSTGVVAFFARDPSLRPLIGNRW